MIYSRFGCQLQIVADCGLVRFNGRDETVTRLVRAIRQDDQAEVHYFSHALKADGGAVEIEAAIAAAPQLTLVGGPLKAAIGQAM